ncbi:MAG: methyltransferase domain-containing protein [Deltaproteobacteria bacterium]|nr:methyltransferase domain-containing protein [Deltaproteobacteria bacterium]
MALEWDYASVAADYDARPPYVAAALAACFDDLPFGSHACDVGAGTGRLAAALAARGFAVAAVEPSPAMRARGVANTAGLSRVAWLAGRAEALPLPSACRSLVTFGASFNVVEPDAALAEAARVLVPGGRLACLWNHRVLDDPVQRRIEERIRGLVPGYRYGSRRDPQDDVLRASGRFARVRALEAACVHRVPVAVWMTAWRSHLTLRRQAGAHFDAVLEAIAAVVAAEVEDEIAVPYVTRCWLAERR